MDFISGFKLAFGVAFGLILGTVVAFASIALILGAFSGYGYF